MKIAVVGSGISGLSAAYYLSKKHHVDLFEKEDHFGGHSHTIDLIFDEKKVSVDIGFIVFNFQTYPNLINFFKENDDFKSWTNEWEKRLKLNNSSDKHLELMKKTNPIVIPRNQKVEEALADADKGNLETMNKLLKVLNNPYSDQENIIEFQKPTPIGNEKYQTFCGT
jgi:uncharacterized protein YdiU (UPF0061 family)